MCIEFIYIYAFSRRFYPKQVTVHSGYKFLSVHVFPGNWTHNLCAANAMLYHWATGTLFNTRVSQLFHDILIYWDAPVCIISIKSNKKTKQDINKKHWSKITKEFGSYFCSPEFSIVKHNFVFLVLRTHTFPQRGSKETRLTRYQMPNWYIIEKY